MLGSFKLYIRANWSLSVHWYYRGSYNLLDNKTVVAFRASFTSHELN